MVGAGGGNQGLACWPDAHRVQGQEAEITPGIRQHGGDGDRAEGWPGSAGPHGGY